MSEKYQMSEAEFIKWKKVRQGGAMRFILTKGVQATLAFAVGLYISVFLFFNDKLNDAHFMFIALLSASIVSFWQVNRLWHRNEQAYLKKSQL